MFRGNYEFTENWFDQNIPVWKKILEKLPMERRFIIEIGSYEGKSACWLVENAFPKGGTLYCVDTWEGSVEHDKEKMAAVQARFKKNIAEAVRAANTGNIDNCVAVEARASTSLLALADLIVCQHEVADLADLIYIDGSHEAKDVLADLTLAYHLLKPGGFIICDDYTWRRTTNPLMSPKIAVDAFYNCFSREISMVAGVPLCQMVFVKHETKNITPPIVRPQHRD
jgi:predicted O-methyltransferase YrrM